MTQPKKKSRCFVISPIGDPDTPARRNADMVLHAIIERALPEMEVIRSDAFGHSEMITKNIINAITTYELAVVDLTDHNPNVFYELGLRHMVEMPVIPICTQGQKIPFDNMVVNTIFYDVTDYHSHTTTADKISKCAQLMLAKDYTVSNPVIAARGEINLAKSADTKDQIISALVDRVSGIERRLRNMDDAKDHALQILSSNNLTNNALTHRSSIADPNRSSLYGLNKKWWAQSEEGMEEGKK